MTTAEPAEFTVDTGLFRQLGELLVGRDSTAVVELIKNAYDADATSVLLRGEHLEDPSQAVITVADDGTGMTLAQFRAGFLRLAARSKTAGQRRSPVYRRRYTGEKGVGRLAAHKLAAVLDATTVAAVDQTASALAAQLRAIEPAIEASDLLDYLKNAKRSLLMAQLDWDLIESAETISEIRDGLIVETGEAEQAAETGTTLVLSRLRHTWTSGDIQDLVRQLSNFEPPRHLTQQIPRTVLPRPLLFEQPTVRDADRQDPGIRLEFEGDFSDPEEFWGGVLRTAEWILEIRAAVGSDIEYALAPTKVGESSNPFSFGLQASRPHPAPEHGPFFDARILLRSGQIPTTEETAWTQFNSGIRVYLEGFRVLPYGEPRNDWLSLDFDYTKRTGRFQIDPLLGGVGDDLESLRNLKARDVSLRLLPNRAFFGAVFLTEHGSGGLRTLVNREGFVPDAIYLRLVEMVSVGIRLLHRARALAGYRLKLHEEPQRDAGTSSDETEQSDTTAGVGGAQDTHPGAEGQADDDRDDDSEFASDDAWTAYGGDATPRGSAARLQAAIADLRASVSRLQTSETSHYSLALLIDRLQGTVREVDSAGSALIGDASLLRVLASVGSQLASFTHELAQLVPTAVAAEKALAPTSGVRWPTEVSHARRTVTDLRRGIERQASYLVDIASTEGRRRRSRQVVHERVDVAFLAFQGTAAARSISLVNRVPVDLRTPPLFRAELQAVLTNLLSNAIKAAGAGGTVQVAGTRLNDAILIRVDNTGVAVTPEDAERWFLPYESTTTEIDLTLGQGMGLGLPITRDIVGEYGGTVRFIRPAKDFATAVEVVIPD